MLLSWHRPCLITYLHYRLKMPAMPIFTPCACIRGKVICLSICPSFHMKIATFRAFQVNICRLKALAYVFASNCLGQPISATNSAFLMAMPIDHTYQCHVLSLLNMLNLECDRIWENRAYCPSVHMAQCAFIVPQVKNCQSSYSCQRTVLLTFAVDYGR